MNPRFLSLLVIMFGCLINEASAQLADAFILGNGSATIKQVYSLKLHGADYRAYLVTWEGSDIVIAKNPNALIPESKTGDRIDFNIIRIKGNSGIACLYFVQTDAEAEKKLLLRGTAPAPNPKQDVELRIGKNGEIRLGGIRCLETELLGKLKELNAEKTSIILISHPDSKYEITVKILDILKKTRIQNVTFTADSEE